MSMTSRRLFSDSRMPEPPSETRSCVAWEARRFSSRTRRRAVSAGVIVHLWSLQVDHGGAVANKSALDRVREICLALPEATEKPFGGHTDPTWRVPDKIFAMYSDNHHGDGRVSQCKAPPGAQEVLRRRPPALLHPALCRSYCWVGIRLDVRPVDWDVLAALVNDSYRMTAPKGLLKQLDPAG